MQKKSFTIKIAKPEKEEINKLWKIHQLAQKFNAQMDDQHRRRLEKVIARRIKNAAFGLFKTLVIAEEWNQLQNKVAKELDLLYTNETPESIAEKFIATISATQTEAEEIKKAYERLTELKAAAVSASLKYFRVNDRHLLGTTTERLLFSEGFEQGYNYKVNLEKNKNG